MKVLMVCLGNICRSPLGEGILQKKSDDLQLGWEVDSAGTGGWHIGEPPHHMSQRVALKNDVDIRAQRGRKFVKEDIDRFDLIYFMDQKNYEDAKEIARDKWMEGKCRLLLEELYPDEKREVPDPYGYPEKNFDEVFQMIDEACEVIVEKYKKK